MSEKKSNIPAILVIGMPIILVIANFIATVHIKVLGIPLYLSVFLFPLTYLISGNIIKSTGDYKNAIYIMAISLVTASFANVVGWVFLGNGNAWVTIYTFLSFLIGQLIFIYTYDFLINAKKDTFMGVFLLLLVVNAIDHAFFGTIIEGSYYNLSILIRLFYVVFIPAVLARSTAKN